MADKPVSLKFVADVAQFLRETKKIEVSTEDIADALVATSNSAQDLERKMSRAMKDAAKDTETLERAIKDLPKATEDAADKAKRDFDKIGDSAGDAGREASSEFKQNLGSGLASGASPAEMIIETFGGLVSGLSGPMAGVAALLAGVGAVAFRELQKNAEETAKLVDTYMNQMRERLGMAADEIDAAFKESQFQDFVTENLDYFQDINDELEAAGINAGDYARAVYEGGDAQKQLKDHLRGVMDAHGRLEGPVGRQKVVYDETGRAAEALLGQVDKLAPTQKEANKEAEVYASIMYGGEASVQRTRDELSGLKHDIEGLPKHLPINVEFYTSGAGAALINPKDVHYSPGHVAIAQSKNKAG